MPKISACIISFNEENKIRECIESLLPVVDEIVLVDSLSNDRTVEIAGSYTDRIFKQEFLGHIEQKNLAVEKASNDWILSLDCDERLLCLPLAQPLLVPGYKNTLVQQKHIALGRHQSTRSRHHRW